MSKEELFKKYQEIVLKTNGGADDYVVALCQISNLIKEFAEEKDQQISDLEAKLAESERKLEEYKKCNCKECMTDYEKNLNQIIDKFLNENIKLKQQLAEKDEEISEYIKIVDDLHKQLSDKCDFCDKTHNQDKISFAIEQLEKVEEILWNSQDIGNVIDNDKFLEKLNYLIKSLKGEK